MRIEELVLIGDGGDVALAKEVIGLWVAVPIRKQHVREVLVSESLLCTGMSWR